MTSYCRGCKTTEANAKSTVNVWKKSGVLMLDNLKTIDILPLISMN